MPHSGHAPGNPALPEVGTIILPGCSLASDSEIAFDVPLCKRIPHKGKKSHWMFRAFRPTEDGPLGMPGLPDVQAENGGPLPMLLGRDYRFDGRRVVMTWAYGQHPSEKTGLVIFAPWMLQGIDMTEVGDPDPEDGAQLFHTLNLGLEITSVKARVAIAKCIRVNLGHELPKSEVYRRRSRHRKSSRSQSQSTEHAIKNDTQT